MSTPKTPPADYHDVQAALHKVKSRKRPQRAPEAAAAANQNHGPLLTRDTALHLVGGAFAGATAKSVTAPLDRVKIIYQVSPDRFTFGSLAGTLGRIWREEGAAGLWRGNSAVLLRILPYASLHFASHEAFEEALRRRRRAMDPESAGVAHSIDRFAAGAGAGAFATLATYPLDLLRARLAVVRGTTAADGSAVTLRSALSSLYAKGPATLFRGVVPTLVGIIPYSGITWLTFQTLRDGLHTLHSPEEADSSKSTDKLIAGALAGLVGQSVTYPLDVARRRLQTGQGSSFVQAGGTSFVGVLADIARREGAAALFKGLSLNWVKGPVATSISFLVHDTVVAKLREAG